MNVPTDDWRDKKILSFSLRPWRLCVEIGCDVHDEFNVE